MNCSIRKAVSVRTSPPDRSLGTRFLLFAESRPNVDCAIPVSDKNVSIFSKIGVMSIIMGTFEPDVNRHNKARAVLDTFSYFRGMRQDWHQDLSRVLNERGISLRRYSEMIGKSESYTKNMIRRGSLPNLPTAITMCDVLGLPLSFLIDGTGTADSAEVEALARAIAKLTPEQKDAVRVMVNTLNKSENESSDHAPAFGAELQNSLD